MDKVTLKSNDKLDFSDFKEHSVLEDSGDNSIFDVSQVVINFFGVSFTFKEKYNTLHVMSCDPNFIIKPCDGNNLKITSENILRHIFSLDDSEKSATEKKLNITRFGTKRNINFNVNSINLEIGEMGFEILGINDGHILISAIEHNKIKIEPVSKNVISVISED